MPRSRTASQWTNLVGIMKIVFLIHILEHLTQFDNNDHRAIFYLIHIFVNVYMWECYLGSSTFSFYSDGCCLPASAGCSWCTASKKLCLQGITAISKCSWKIRILWEIYLELSLTLSFSTLIFRLIIIKKHATIFFSSRMHWKKLFWSFVKAPWWGQFCTLIFNFNLDNKTP